MIFEIYNYLKSPRPDLVDDLNFKQKAVNIINAYFIYLLLTLFAIIILLGVDKLLVYAYDYSIASHLMSGKEVIERFGPYGIFILTPIGPLVEEILFRLPLNFKKSSIGIFISMVVYRFTGNHLFEFDPNEIYSYLRIGFAAIAFAAVLLFFPDHLLSYIKKKYFKIAFYLSAIAFGLVHVTNFAPYNLSVLWFYPLFTLPQLIAGFLIGYLRVRQGFISGWILHSLINLPSAVSILF